MRGNKQKGINSIMLIIAGTVLIASAFIFSIINTQKTKSNLGTLSNSSSAPPLKLMDLDGHKASLDDYLGTVVLVNNWATWCPPCKAEMPILQSFYDNHKGNGFVIVAISAGDSEDLVRDFVDNYELSFPIWLDPDSEALQAFQLSSIPNSILIDRDGQIRFTWVGPVTYTMLEEQISPLLQEK